ncbi:Guanine exchange factor for Rac 30 [Pelomyxa schiedti]|nr:Guanine exchange factor for Rac 30 [Pelomyxa schiedti]
MAATTTGKFVISPEMMQRTTSLLQQASSLLPPTMASDEPAKKLLFLSKSNHPAAKLQAFKIFCNIAANKANGPLVVACGAHTDIINSIPEDGPNHSALPEALRALATLVEVNEKVIDAMIPVARTFPHLLDGLIGPPLDHFLFIIAKISLKKHIPRLHEHGIYGAVAKLLRSIRTAPEGSIIFTSAGHCLSVLFAVIDQHAYDVFRLPAVMEPVLDTALVPSNLGDQAISVCTQLSLTSEGQNILLKSGGITILGDSLSSKSNPDTIFALLKLFSNLTGDPACLKALETTTILRNVLDVVVAIPPTHAAIGQAVKFLCKICSTSEQMAFLSANGGLDILVSVAPHLTDPSAAECLSLLLGNIVTEVELQVPFVEAGLHKNVIGLLASENSKVSLHAARGVANMTIADDGIRRELYNCGVVQPLQHLLKSSNNAAQVQTLKSITNLALCYSKSSELVEHTTVLPTLHAMLGSTQEDVKANITRVLTNLTLHDNTRTQVVQEIGVKPVIQMLETSSSTTSKQAALTLLGNVLMDGSARKWVLDHKTEVGVLDAIGASRDPEIAAQVSFIETMRKLPPAMELNLAKTTGTHAVLRQTSAVIPEPVLSEQERQDQLDKQRLALEAAKAIAEVEQNHAEKNHRKRMEKEEARRRQKEEEDKEKTRRLLLEQQAAIQKAKEEKGKLLEAERQAQAKMDAGKRQESEQRLHMIEQMNQQLEQARSNAELQLKQMEKEKLRKLEISQKTNLTLQREMEKDKQSVVQAQQKIREEEEKLRVVEAKTPHHPSHAHSQSQAAPPHTSSHPHTHAHSQSQAPSNPPSRPPEPTPPPKPSDVHLARTNIVNEILETERTYVGGLNKMICNYERGLQAALEAGSPIITREQIKSLFSNLDVIANFNKVLLDCLEERMKNWTDTTRIGDVFCSTAAFLKCYVEYINNYNHCLTTLSELSNTKKFAAFLERVEASHPTDLPLVHTLIIPIQRIPRYCLLLTDLLRKTPATHPDYANLKSALEAMKATGDYLNEKKRMAEMLCKIYQIQIALRGKNKPTIVEPHRYWIREGYVKLVKKHSAKPAILHLCNDLILLSKLKGKAKFTFVASIKLDSLVLNPQVTDAPKNLPAELLLRLTDKVTLSSHVTLAADPAAKQTWMETIPQAITVWTKAHPPGSIPLSSSAPVRSTSTTTSTTSRLSTTLAASTRH